LRPHPLARRYAKALFELALEKKNLEQVSEEVRSFGESLERESRLRAYLLSPEVDKRQKLNVVDRLFKDKVSGLFFHFLLLLVNKGRQRYIAEIVFEFARFYDLQKNRVRAVITTAILLQQIELEQIRKTLSQQLQAEIILENRVEPDILGGTIIRVGGKVIDGSLAHQVEMLGRQMRTTKAQAA
jgi:F-type H+-transporting ATPase subunit delta